MSNDELVYLVDGFLSAIGGFCRGEKSTYERIGTKGWMPRVKQNGDLEFPRQFHDR